jgi:hypothetical protein
MHAYTLFDTFSKRELLGEKTKLTPFCEALGNYLNDKLSHKKFSKAEFLPLVANRIEEAIESER